MLLRLTRSFGLLIVMLFWVFLSLYKQGWTNCVGTMKRNGIIRYGLAIGSPWARNYVPRPPRDRKKGSGGSASSNLKFPERLNTLLGGLLSIVTLIVLASETGGKMRITRYGSARGLRRCGNSLRCISGRISVLRGLLRGVLISLRRVEERWDGVLLYGGLDALEG